MSDGVRHTGTGGHEGAGRDDRSRSWVPALRRYGPFVAIAVVLTAAALMFRDGDGEDDGGGASPAATGDELVLTGPMTHARAELEEVDAAGIDFGPHCDLETERIMLPTVYAPPCVELFKGDNGGATSTGVTDDTIKLVVYLSNLQEESRGAVSAKNADLKETIDRYVDLYNEMFETYGRTVEVEYYPASGAANNEALARADAIAIAEKEPFAVLGGPLDFNVNQSFSDELAAGEIICLPGCALSGMPESFVERNAPYVWSDGMTAAQSMGITGDAVGTLAGPGPAEMAGDPEIQARDRVYALLYETSDDTSGVDAFRDAMADHGIDSVETVEYDSDDSQAQRVARTVIVQLKSAGVTTVVYAGGPSPPQWFTAEATAQDYSPEWILGPNYYADTATYGRMYDQDQWKNGFGLGVRLSAVTTVGHAGGVYEWAYGDEAPWGDAGTLEPGLRTLFTGVHLAGPELAPESFRDGLWRYPPSGDIVGTMSWGDHSLWPGTDYGSSDDVAIIWWDPEARAPDADLDDPDDKGLYRLGNNGQRYGFGEFPESAEDAGLFVDDSSVLMYGVLPEELSGYVDYPPPEI